ncbi:hypothetical protein [Herbaspirillum huttiense]|uniref:hypothetical protein n=1 Tax=Herbaspirillum huttiense TaxID=863372 RepID=UPI002E76D345|nr:hypothetical protein [Herbaspirillum huttiense]MEE1636401.1 hypothetical protein [Herbaspirillum huttiense NC40101]
MNERTAFEAVINKRRAVNEADKNGHVADSMEVRKALMARVHSGEITLQEAQKQLKKIQNGAKSKGLMTRAQAYNEG